MIFIFVSKMIIAVVLIATVSWWNDVENINSKVNRK
jgi:hypothetical protein